MSFVLVFGNDSQTCLEIEQRLSGLGIKTLTAATISSARELCKTHPFDLAVIELNQEFRAGFDLSLWIRASSDLPILALVDSVGVDEFWFAVGANDHLLKPFGPRTLSLRVMQQLGRERSKQPSANQMLIWGPLRLDLAQHEFFCNQTLIALTNTEFQIVSLLMQNPEQVFTREQILNSIGVFSNHRTEHIINVHLSRIRVKIRTAGGPKVIKVVRSVGFRLGERNHPGSNSSPAKE